MGWLLFGLLADRYHRNYALRFLTVFVPISLLLFGFVVVYCVVNA